MVQLKMKNLTQPQTVIFLHIHKTGGRTLEKILEKQYKTSEIVSTDNLKWRQAKEDLRKQSSETLNKAKLIEGHMYFGLHDLLTQPFTYVTMLRNPIDRVLSLYCYIRDEPKNPQHKTLIDNNMNLEQFLDSGIAKTVENGQTRVLSGIQAEDKPCSQEMLALAKENLSKYFTVIGLTERFDETLILLKQTFGYRLPIYKTINKNKKRLPRKAISNQELQKIRDLNKFDIELYEYAEKVFQKKVEEQGYLFPLECRYFKFLLSLNKSYENSHLKPYFQKVINKF
ncbi:MAG: sulfotransferase family 2 domain-containing protein [Crocosphaera sp.]